MVCKLTFAWVEAYFVLVRLVVDFGCLLWFGLPIRTSVWAYCLVFACGLFGFSEFVRF